MPEFSENQPNEPENCRIFEGGNKMYGVVLTKDRRERKVKYLKHKNFVLYTK